MSAVMDHIAGSGDDGARKTGSDGFETLWSDMPPDVCESVRLSAGQTASVARLTMSGPAGKVEIRITPRQTRADAACPTAGGAQPRPAHPQVQAMPAEEEDQTP